VAGQVGRGSKLMIEFGSLELQKPNRSGAMARALHTRACRPVFRSGATTAMPCLSLDVGAYVVASGRAAGQEPKVDASRAPSTRN
jgi:hypothetical protein